MFHKTTLLLIALVFAPAASAYIGPGAGISVLGSLLGAITTLLVAILAILRWPVRWAFRRMRKRFSKAEDEMAQNDTVADQTAVSSDSVQPPTPLEK